MRAKFPTIINLNSNQSKRIGEISIKIQELQQLQPGWDYGEGEAISDEVAKSALIIAEFGLNSGLSANVRPSSDGELIITLFKGDRFLFISATPNNVYGVVYEQGIGAKYEELDSKNNLSLTSLFNYIRKWVLSELYTFKNMTVMRTVSQAMPSKSIEMGKYQYSTNNVLYREATDQYADTLNSITKRQSATPLCFAD